MTAALENIDDRPTLRFERRYDHGVERVWRAITDPDELRHWFPPGEELEVTGSEPPRLLAGSWSATSCVSSYGPTATGACSCSLTPSTIATRRPETRRAETAASCASRPCCAASP
jgi:hypothetical protein